MGLFDIFKGKGGKSGEKKAGSAGKWAEAAGSKRAQAYDRQEAIQELTKLATAEAAEALLKRFTFNTDPSITDHEEKQLAFEGILKAGKEALEPIRAFAEKAQGLNWPIKILKEILTEDEMVDELIEWLAKWDTEYAKFIDPKLDLLQQLGEYQSPKIRPAVEPFLQDASEPARFFAVAALLSQKEREALPALVALMLDEESVRIRTRVADGLQGLAWELADDVRDAFRKVLPPQFGVDGAGLVTKR